MKIEGKEVANNITAHLSEQPPPKKILAVVLIGKDPRSLSFIRQKEKVAKELGVDVRIHQLSEELGNDELRREIGRIAGQKPVGGILVQLPVPEGVNKHYVLNAIPPEKDVDVLGERTLGAFYNNRSRVTPPAVGTVKEIIERTRTKLKESNVAVVGTGTLVGRPVGTWLFGRCRELLVLGSKSNLRGVGNADIVISGVGKAGIIDPAALKHGAGVIDFGYYYAPDGEVSGDLQLGDAENLENLTFYTPTPGGTGPILVAKLMENFYTLCGQ